MSFWRGAVDMGAGGYIARDDAQCGGWRVARQIEVPIYTDDAIEDLRHIRIFIAKDSPERAMEKGAIIDAMCRLLDVRPMMGRTFLGLRLFTKRL